MRTLPAVATALAALLAPTVCAAQGAASAASDDGFFKPLPNGDLSITHVPETATSLPPRPVAPAPIAAPSPSPAASAVANPIGRASAATAQAPVVQVPVVVQPQLAAPDPMAATRRADEQADRAEAEARAAQQRAVQSNPAPINGAFTGSTDERDR